MWWLLKSRVHFGLLLNESRCASKVKGLEKAAWKKSKNVNSTGGKVMRDGIKNEEMYSVCAFSGPLCHPRPCHVLWIPVPPQKEKECCERLTSEIMCTGYAIMGVACMIGLTSYFRHRIPYEILYAVHHLLFISHNVEEAFNALTSLRPAAAMDLVCVCVCVCVTLRPLFAAFFATSPFDQRVAIVSA
jgi:hypothetical protein